MPVAVTSHSFQLIEMEVATPGGLARALDPGLSTAREAAKALPPGKLPPQCKSTHFICLIKKYVSIKKVQHLCAEPFKINHVVGLGSF